MEMIQMNSSFIPTNFPEGSSLSERFVQKAQKCLSKIELHCSDYNVRKLQKLPYIDQCADEDIEEKVSRCFEIVREYNLPEAGIARLHHHFPISDREKIVNHLCLDRQEVFAEVQQIDRPDSLTLPYMWKAGKKEGEWLPVQFVQIQNDEPSRLFLKDLNKVTKNVDFLRTMWRHIRDCEDQKRLGLVLNLSKFVGVGMGDSQFCLLETTDEEARTQLSRSILKEGMSQLHTITTYHIDPSQNDKRQEQFCYLVCERDPDPRGHHRLGHRHRPDCDFHNIS